MDLLPYLLFAFVASITPGPTNILILANSQRYGVKATLSAVVGACVSASLIVMISGAGAGELLHQYPLVRQIMSWIGALWLSWLSWHLFSAPPPDLAGGTQSVYRSRGGVVTSGESENLDDGTGGGEPVCANGPASAAGDCADGAVVLLISLVCLVAWAWLGQVVNRMFRTERGLVGFQRTMALLLLLSAWMGMLK